MPALKVLDGQFERGRNCRNYIRSAKKTRQFLRAVFATHLKKNPFARSHKDLSFRNTKWGIPRLGLGASFLKTGKGVGFARTP